MNAVRARSALLLIAAAMCCTPALARFAISPLHEVVTRSAHVVDATILSGRVAGYAYRDYSADCGFVYEARIAESFKGSLAGTFTFASNVAMAPGSRHLLFLRREAGDFPSDVHVILEDEDDPDFGAAVERAKAACIAGLPTLKSNFLHHIEFTTSEDLRRVLVLPSRWIGLGPELPTESLRDARALPWEPLRTWLRTLGDLPDTSDWASRCDDSCLAQRLNYIRETMRRNLAAIRSALPTATARAALEASEQAGERFTRSSCDAFVAQWADRGLSDSLALDCRLARTFAWTRELWLLRRSPILALPALYDPCDSACRSDALAERERDLATIFGAQHQRLAARPAAQSLFDLAQADWRNYAQAHCRMAADTLSPGTDRDQVLVACRLRLVDARLREVTWWHEEFALDDARQRLGGTTTPGAPASAPN